MEINDYYLIKRHTDGFFIFPAFWHLESMQGIVRTEFEHVLLCTKCIYQELKEFPKKEIWFPCNISSKI
jgi:hypothetical protein